MCAAPGGSTAHRLPLEEYRRDLSLSRQGGVSVPGPGVGGYSLPQVAEHGQVSQFHLLGV